MPFIKIWHTFILQGRNRHRQSYIPYWQCTSESFLGKFFIMALVTMQETIVQIETHRCYRHHSCRCCEEPVADDGSIAVHVTDQIRTSHVYCACRHVHKTVAQARKGRTGPSAVTSLQETKLSTNASKHEWQGPCCSQCQHKMWPLQA